MQNIFANNVGRYFSLNWQLFPQAEGTKVPIKGTRGLNEASANRAQLMVWAKLYPRANIGLRCGPESGVIVIDIDPRNGGDKTLANLAKKGLVLPDTVEASTPSGGRHLFYAYDDRVCVSGSNKLGPGIDICTNGHAVTLPPSYNAERGKFYRWVRSPRGTDLPRLPRWVIDMLKPKPMPKVAPMPRIDFANLQGYRRQAMADLDRMAKRIAALADGRHEAPFKAGASLGVYVHHGVLDPGLLEQAVMAACQSNGALTKYKPQDLRKQIANGILRARGDHLPRLAREHREYGRQAA